MEFEKFVKIRQEKFGAVIFETLTEKVFVTNQTGAKILSLFEKYKDRKKIIDELTKIYNADKATIEKDVDGFISQLKEKKLLRDEE